MKRIVILCDGTWSRWDSRTPTNVIRLAQALSAEDAGGVAQVPVYIRGVGAGNGVTGLNQTLDKLLGGAFGWGLMENIVEAYRHLVFLWEPGDEIYIFGFSRGAYTARSLTGLIRATGIVGRDALDRIPEAAARYRWRAPETHPQSEESHAFRARLSPRVVTSPEESAWRAARGAPPAPQLRIAYLGIWDTVGALGVPPVVPVLGRLTARRHEFHDARLSSMVRAARHAVALDERRRPFEPTLWNNVAALNGEAGGKAAYSQLWFLGDHGSVGGGGDIRALSSIALRWIVEGAEEAGLAFDPGWLRSFRDEEDEMGPLNGSAPRSGLIGWITRLRRRDREGPGSFEELHPAVYRRWSAPATGAPPYRPGSLSRIEAQLLARREAERSGPATA